MLNCRNSLLCFLTNCHLLYRQITINSFENVGFWQNKKVMIFFCNNLLVAFGHLIILPCDCSRIGATHSVIFAGFSSKAIASRVQDMQATAIITANEGKISRL